jgi:hypothetical protein
MPGSMHVACQIYGHPMELAQFRTNLSLYSCDPKEEVTFFAIYNNKI